MGLWVRFVDNENLSLDEMWRKRPWVELCKSLMRQVEHCEIKSKALSQDALYHKQICERGTKSNAGENMTLRDGRLCSRLWPIGKLGRMRMRKRAAWWHWERSVLRGKSMNVWFWGDNECCCHLCKDGWLVQGSNREASCGEWECEKGLHGDIERVWTCDSEGTTRATDYLCKCLTRWLLVL